MNTGIGLAFLVVIAVLEEATGFPDQQLDLEYQSQGNDEEYLDRQLPGCGTKRPCKIAGGMCQSIKEECNGELRTDGFYCKNSQKCGCCIPAGPKGCVFGFKTYEDGAIIEDVCMLLQCKEASWKYLGIVRNECGNCSVWGDPHFNIFDNHTTETEHGNYYKYLEDGVYTVIRNGIEYQNQTEFGVESEFVPCPFGDDVSCVKSVTYYEPSIRIVMTIPEPDNNCDGDDDPQCAITVYVNHEIRKIGRSVESFYATDGTVLVFRHEHVASSDRNLNCMNVIGSQGLSVSFCSHQGDYAYFYIFAMPTLRHHDSHLYGLCGTYTGITQAGYTKRDGTSTTDTDDFAASWEITTTRSNSVAERAASVNKCLNPVVLLEITAECTLITKEPCEVMGPRWCKAFTAACVFDLCRVPNHDSYAAGYASHMAVQTHLVGGPLVGSGSCSCHYVPFHFGCVIRTPAPPNHACKCTAHWTSHCSGAVVNCINPSSYYCIHPNLNKQSCQQASGSNCDGY